MKDTLQGKVLELYANQSSGVLSSASFSDGLAVLEIGRAINKGDMVEFIPYTSLY